MTQIFNKKNAFILVLFFLSSTLFAQESMIQRVDVTAHRNNQYAVFLEGGFNSPYTDVQKPGPGAIFGIGGSYSPISYVNLVFQIQKGNLTEGRKSIPYAPLNYNNSYVYSSIMGRLAPLKIFKRPDEGFVKFLDGYCGLGMALMFNNVKTGVDSSPSLGKIDHYKGVAFIIPYELGYTLPVYTLAKDKSQISVNINYRNHFSFSDKLDGYVPNVASNKSNDVFNQLTFGILYAF